MSERRKSLVIAASVLLVVPLALVANIYFARRLLRLDHPDDPFAAIRKHMTPVAQPLLILGVGHYAESGRLSRFAQEIGLTSAQVELLPSTHECFVPFNYVARSNPYPALLSEVSGGQPDSISYGYLGVDRRYHQITFYGGEADTTPSFLVKKVRGQETHWGDYFVRYTVYLSSDPLGRPKILDNATGRVLEREPPGLYPSVDRIDWSTYVGGSYDGFEELTFAAVATPIEAVFVVAVMLWVRRRRAAA